jgi:hypothetical protein
MYSGAICVGVSGPGLPAVPLHGVLFHSSASSNFCDMQHIGQPHVPTDSSPGKEPAFSSK